VFLIRWAFWLGLVVLLLPTDSAQQERLYHTASTAVHRAATFCERNGEVCAKGGEYWAVFRQKLEFGARLAIDLASERFAGSQRTQSTPPASRTGAGTLTPTDVAPAWRGGQKA